MTDQQFKILAMTALALFLVAAAFYSGIDLFVNDFRAGSPLIQGLDTSKIATIEIKSKDNVATFQRSGDQFLLKEKNNYPASIEEINNLLIKALEIRLAERITDNAGNHADLGVGEEGGDETVTIRFFDEEGNPLTGIIRGNGVERSGGIYVRRVDDDTVYSTDGYLYIESQPLEYVKKNIFGVEAKDIDRVEVSDPDDAGYVIARVADEPEVSGDEDTDAEQVEPDESIVLLSVPPGREADEDEYEEVFEILEDLEFDDVVPAAEKQLAWNAEYRCRLKNGLTYVIRTAQDGDDWYMVVGAITPLQGEQVTITRDEDEEELKRKEALLLANDTAESFNTHNTGWIYKISEDDAEVLRRPMEDLLVSQDDEEEGA